MRRALLILAISLTQSACLGGPHEALLKVEIGEKEVILDARLRDVRVWTEDELEGMRTFLLVATPEAVQELVGEDYAYLGRPTTWAWSKDGEKLNLHVVASMPRERFDACLVESQNGREPRGSPCKGFPLWKHAGELVSALEEVEEIEVKGPSRWPISATSLTTSYVWKEVQPFSAAGLFVRYSADPEGMAKFEARLGAFKQALGAGNVKRCKETLSGSRSELPTTAAMLFEEGAEREQLRLLRGFLEDQDAPPVLGDPAAFDRVIGSPRKEYSRLLPKVRAPRELLLEFARLYDLAHYRGYVSEMLNRRRAPVGERGENESMLGISVPRPELRATCDRLIKRSRKFRDLCGLVTLE